MKKYNLSQIMKRAWEIRKNNRKNIFSLCLRMAWKEAKKGASMEEIKKLVETYRIEEADGNRIKVNVNPTKLFPEEIQNIKSHKAEILVYLREERRKAKEAQLARERKIQAIEGLSEIMSCMNAWEEWNDDFRAMMETGRSYMTAKKPETKVEELRVKYPVADAYLKAKKEARRSNFERSSIGENALNRIIEGENYKEVMNDMEQEINKVVDSHIWD